MKKETKETILLSILTILIFAGMFIFGFFAAY